MLSDSVFKGFNFSNAFCGILPNSLVSSCKLYENKFPTLVLIINFVLVKFVSLLSKI